MIRTCSSFKHGIGVSLTSHRLPLDVSYDILSISMLVSRTLPRVALVAAQSAPLDITLAPTILIIYDLT